MATADEALVRLERWGAERDWIGPDPYEGLNSPLGRLTHGRRPRQAVIQASKRLPFSPPPPLAAAPRPNAKVAGLVLSGYASPAGRALPGATHFLESLPRRIGELDLGPADGSWSAWGYHFDVQVRHLFYPRTQPNAIATCFVVNGLLDAARAMGRPELAAQALAARAWLLRLRHESAHGPFFAYVEPGSQLIHNANLMVAGTLARLEDVAPDGESREAIESCVATTVALQRDDGLWDYGEAGNLRWADNFHTAYTLHGLLRAAQLTGRTAEDALTAGVDAWLDAFVEPDGWCRYFPGSRFPLEPHSAASAIDLLADLPPGRTVADPAERARAIAACAIDQLFDERRGCFAHRRTARGLNRRVFMRWTNAPMFQALARLEAPSPEAGAG